MMGFHISRLLVKPLLRLQHMIPHCYLVMCRGYNEDDVNFTELVWEEDKDLDFFDKQNYPEFQIWTK